MLLLVLLQLLLLLHEVLLCHAGCVLGLLLLISLQLSDLCLYLSQHLRLNVSQQLLNVGLSQLST